MLRARAVRSPVRPVVRLLLLLIILVAFARVVWQLDAKSLWWDESLSLQRAESDWPSLLLGRIVLSDGVNQIRTADQHPFGFFVLLRILIGLAGTSEFVLRFPAVMGATLLVPIAWTLARRLVRQRLLPPASPGWAVLLTALNPFFLWYGQEARMYTLLPFLALGSTYLLLRWASAETPVQRRRYLAGYAVSLILLASTHYFSLLLLPIHVFIALHQTTRGRRKEPVAVVGFLSAAGLLILLVAWSIYSQPSQGSNFSRVSLKMLIPDLVNAFSLGLSVDIKQVIWFDAIFGLLALAGGLWCFRGRLARPASPLPQLAWLMPAFVAFPILVLQVVQVWKPAYMNARHISLISGAYVLLVSGGIGWLWQRSRWIGAALGFVLLGAMLYSTANYYALPQYSKDEFAKVGEYLRSEILPGDVVLVAPPEMLRLYRYYLPLDSLPMSGRAEPTTAWQAVPLLGRPFAETTSELETLLGQHRRAWLVASGMVPLNPQLRPTRDWLQSHAFLVREASFHSVSSFLTLRLYLSGAPVTEQLPAGVQHPLASDFGEQIRLAGYEVAQPLAGPSASTPITLYWQPLTPLTRRYKYSLRLVASDAGGADHTLAVTEREPYDGMLPTITWRPGQTITEFSQLPASGRRDPSFGASRLLLQVYDAETLAKLPVSATGGLETADNGNTLVLPYAQ